MLALKELSILSSRIDLLSLPPKKLLINTINAHSYNTALKDPLFAEALIKGDVLIPDGASIVIACKWLKAKSQPKERIAGWDLFEFEMKQLKPEMTFRDLVTSGFTIGKDMSGTMSQTLILAFIGSSLTAMLVLTAYGVQFNQFLSSNYMAIEFLHGIIGGVSVVISIPVSVILSAWFLEKRRARRTAKK